MSRTNIFDLIKQNNNMAKDVSRLKELFEKYYFAEEVDINTNYRQNYTLKEFVDQFCFSSWSNRNRCISVDDFLNTLNYQGLLVQVKLNDQYAFFSVIEAVYNFWHLAAKYIDEHLSGFRYYEAVNLLKELMDDCLSEYNQKAFYFPDKEKCIIAEVSPQVTAAAEATEPEVSIEIVRYNHRLMKGDIAGKKAVLKTMGDYLEGRKGEIKGINNALYDNISGALNNLNIRHNNINEANKSTFKRTVADMTTEELETHYDDLYQLILLAILEIDNVERQRDMKALIQRVNEK